MITATVLLKGAPKHLKEVLESLDIFDEILIYDNGASSEALEICRHFPKLTLHQGSFLGFGPTHNKASSLAKNDWIFSVDSDEVVTPELKKEIKNLKLSPDTVYVIPRHNEYNGKWIKWCGWSPDQVTRLYHRKKTSFSEALVHEGVMTSGLKQQMLKNPLRHYSYDSISDFLTKMQSYTELFAKQHAGKKKSSPLKAILHAKAAFFKSYVVKKGFLGGYEGFLISSYNAITAFYKYLKLYEANLKSFDVRRKKEASEFHLEKSKNSH